MADFRMGQPHVLIVDGDEALRRLYDDLLAEEGCRTTLRAYPDGGADAVVALAPDLIVLDLVIGEAETGSIFLDRLKSDPATVAIPVLVCTAAQPLVERLQDRLSAWDCEVLAKPFDIDELVVRVHACLRRAESRRAWPISGGDHLRGPADHHPLHRAVQSIPGATAGGPPFVPPRPSILGKVSECDARSPSSCR